MKNTLRSLVVAAGIASATVMGYGLAFADTTTGPTAAGQTAGEHQHGCSTGMQRHGKHGKHFLKVLAKKLDLTDQQKTQAKALWQQHRDQAKPLFADMRTQRQQLRALVFSGTADEAAIRAQSAKVASLQADLAVQRAKGAKEFIALLTPDQQAKLKALEAKWAEKMSKRHHEGPEE